MTNQELLKRLQALETAERDVASSMDMPQELTANWEYAETAATARSAILQQRQDIEHLRAYQQQMNDILKENSQLRKALELIKDGEIPQAMSPALFAEFILRGPVPQTEAND